MYAIKSKANRQNKNLNKHSQNACISIIAFLSCFLNNNGFEFVIVDNDFVIRKPI